MKAGNNDVYAKARPSFSILLEIEQEGRQELKNKTNKQHQLLNPIPSHSSSVWPASSDQQPLRCALALNSFPPPEQCSDSQTRDYADSSMPREQQQWPREEAP